ncbi:MAG: SAP domain-containing protein, partial [Pseudomonadota bacterium]
MPPPTDLAATGPVLHRLVEAALAEHGALLVPEEIAAVERFLALPPAAGHLYARLLQRVRETFREDGLDEEDQAVLPLLEAATLIDSQVAPAERVEALRVPELQAACRALGLPAGGLRAALIERLEGLAPPGLPALRRTLHRPLFQRLQRLLLRHPRADLKVVVLDMIGVQPRPEYAPGPGAPLFASRAELLDFEAARAALDLCREGAPALPFLEPALAWLAASPPPTPANRHFSTRRVAARLLALAARELERAGEPTLALALYERLLEEGSLEPGELAQRAVLAAGFLDPARAVDLAARWHPRVDPAAAIALGRS